MQGLGIFLAEHMRSTRNTYELREGNSPKREIVTRRSLKNLEDMRMSIFQELAEKPLRVLVKG